MASDVMPKGASLKQLDWINIWKPKEGETSRSTTIVVYDAPRVIWEHRKFVRNKIYNPNKREYEMKPTMHHIRCNQQEVGFCQACLMGEYSRVVLAVPVVELSSYVDKTGQKRIGMYKKILGLGTKSNVKAMLEAEIGTDYKKWVGYKLKLTRTAGDAGESTGNMVKILNDESSGLPKGKAMLDALLEKNPHIELAHIETVDFDKVALVCMDNDNLAKFINQLNGADVQQEASRTSGKNSLLAENADEIIEGDEIPF